MDGMRGWWSGWYGGVDGMVEWMVCVHLIASSCSVPCKRMSDRV